MSYSRPDTLTYHCLSPTKLTTLIREVNYDKILAHRNRIFDKRFLQYGLSKDNFTNYWLIYNARIEGDPAIALFTATTPLRDYMKDVIFHVYRQ